METKSTGLKCGDDHFMPTITTLRGNAMHIDVVDVHGADGFCNGHERSCTPLSSLVTSSTSGTHRMLQCVRADMESPRPAHRHGLNNLPHPTVGFDRYKAVSFRVVDCGDPEVTSSNLETQCDVISQTVIRELIEPISDIAPRRHRDGSRKHVQSLMSAKSTRQTCRYQITLKSSQALCVVDVYDND